MAIDFGVNNANSTRYYACNTHQATSPPVGADWCCGLVVKVDTNPGTSSQCLISNGGAWNFILLQSGHATQPNQLGFLSGTLTAYGTGNALPIDGVWRLVVFQRRGDNIEIWFCPAAAGPQTATLAGSVNRGSWNGAVTSSDLLIGTRTTPSARWYHQKMAATFMFNGLSLTQAQIEAIATGTDPRTLGTPQFMHWLKAPDATLLDVMGQASGVRNGTGWVTALADPAVISDWFADYASHAFLSPTVTVQADACATWMTTRPTAIRHGTKTFLTYHKDTPNPGLYVAQIDHANSDAISSLQLAAITAKDDHNLGCVLRRASDGRIMVFRSEQILDSQTSPSTFAYCVSTNPDDATAFGPWVDIPTATASGIGTYSTVFQLSTGRIVLCGRTSQSVTPYENWLVYSDDGGTTWSAKQVLVSGSATNTPYFHAAKDTTSDDIHFVMTKPTGSGNNGEIVDVRHFIWRAGTLYGQDGTSLGTGPLDFPNLPVVWDTDTTDQWTFNYDIRCYAGVPELLFYTFSPTGDDDFGELRWAKWTGSAWTVSVLATRQQRTNTSGTETKYMPGAVLDPETPGRVLMGLGGFDRTGLTIARTFDNGATWRTWPVTLLDGPDTLKHRFVEGAVRPSNFVIAACRGTYDAWGGWDTNLVMYANPAEPFEPPAPPPSGRRVPAALLALLAA